jgi:transcriptional regulator with XRE-family HTH domain
MPVRSRAVDRGTARGRRIVVELCREIEEARLDRGLSYASIGRALGLSGQQVGRICRGQSPELGVVRLAQLLAVVGLDLSARAFPGGPPIRDAGHVALLERLRARLGPGFVWRTEVPVAPMSIDGAPDLRAWDVTLSGRGFMVAVEAETHVRDLQALERRIALKLRDGVVAGVILLLSDTQHHQIMLREAGTSLRAAFPVSARKALRRLANGEPPEGNAILLL